jgi:hypothetical protein
MYKVAGGGDAELGRIMHCGAYQTESFGMTYKECNMGVVHTESSKKNAVEISQLSVVKTKIDIIYNNLNDGRKQANLVASPATHLYTYLRIRNRKLASCFRSCSPAEGNRDIIDIFRGLFNHSLFHRVLSRVLKHRPISLILRV